MKIKKTTKGGVSALKKVASLSPATRPKPTYASAVTGSPSRKHKKEKKKMTKEDKAAHALMIESKLKRLPVFKSHTIMNLIEN